MEGADSIFVYVALGAFEKPLDLIFLSSTSFDKFRDACARLGCNEELGVGVEMAGVESPSVEVLDSSGLGVAAPLLSWVGIRDASFLTASPRMVLIFLLRR
jgi:hypothetical protein